MLNKSNLSFNEIEVMIQNWNKETVTGLNEKRLHLLRETYDLFIKDKNLRFNATFQMVTLCQILDYEQ